MPCHAMPCHAMPGHATLPSCRRCGCMRYRCRPVAHQAPIAREPTQLCGWVLWPREISVGTAAPKCLSYSVHSTLLSHRLAHTHTTPSPSGLHITHPISPCGVASAKKKKKKKLLCHYPCTSTVYRPGARSLQFPSFSSFSRWRLLWSSPGLSPLSSSLAPGHAQPAASRAPPKC